MATLSTDRSTLKILVAEDDKISQKLLSMLLKKISGCEPDLAETGDEASDFARRKQYDFIFMDYNMPGCNGAEAVRMIRSDPGLSKQPYIVGLSASFGEEIDRFLSSGLDQFMGKPISIEHIRAILSV